MNLVASYVGAPPANVRTTMAGADGGLISAAMGLAMNGFLDSNPDLVPVFDRTLNAGGKKMMADTATMCIADVIAVHPLARSSAWTVDGRTLGQVVDSEPLLAKVIGDQRIG